MPSVLHAASLLLPTIPPNGIYDESSANRAVSQGGRVTWEAGLSKNYKSGTLRAKPGTLVPREARDGAKFGDFRSKLGKIWTSGRFPGTTDDDADLGTRCPRSQAAFG